jgi:heme exporter protein C
MSAPGAHPTTAPAVPSTSPGRLPARSSPLFLLGVLLCAGGFLGAPFLIVGAPVERTMGMVQKIFYFHVPCAWVLLLSTLFCGGASLAYLFKGSQRGDRLAVAAAEVGVLFGACTLVTGPLWGRGAWGHYWVWDARLTSSLLLWLVLVAYLMARKYGGPGARKLGAALALFAAADVPLVYVSVNIWRTIHPTTEVVKTLAPGMRGPYWASVLLFLIFSGLLLALRYRLETARAALEELHLAVEDAEEST